MDKVYYIPYYIYGFIALKSGDKKNDTIVTINTENVTNVSQVPGYKLN